MLLSFIYVTTDIRTLAAQGPLGLKKDKSKIKSLQKVQRTLIQGFLMGLKMRVLPLPEEKLEKM